MTFTVMASDRVTIAAADQNMLFALSITGVYSGRENGWKMGKTPLTLPRNQMMPSNLDLLERDTTYHKHTALRS
jgi:hypothetical protein